MRRRRSGSGPLGELAGSPILVGAVAVLVAVVGVFLSYNANEGLPFVPTYAVKVDVPDAAELVAGDEVRIGGARVGQVKTIEAMPARGARKPYAKLELALDVNQGPLPSDSTVQVRPRSILGSKYLALMPGRAKRTIPEDGTLPLARAVPVVELDEALNVFDRDTTEGLRNTLRGLGDAFAGRGASFNEVIASTRRLLPPTQRLLAVLIAPGTDLPGFISGAAAATAALAPVASTLGDLVDHAAVTLAALDAAGNAVGDTLEELPPTETVGTRALERSGPVLADAAAIARALQPAAPLLPGASAKLAASLEAATPVLRNTTGKTLGAALSGFNRFVSSPAALGSARKLRSGAALLLPLLRYLEPVQLTCNVFGTWGRNLASAGSEGDANGTWLRFIPVTGSNEIFQDATPDPNLHLNFYPNEDGTECESGNEVYTPGQHIGNPPGKQSQAAETTLPPPGVADLARKAGLLVPVPEEVR
jgi:phospholipid/cholesterol/gamma-HCH transport system substrate-binding protein